MARNPENVEDLWLKLVDERARITVAQCQDFVKSCSRRCAAVITVKTKIVVPNIKWSTNMCFLLLSPGIF